MVVSDKLRVHTLAEELRVSSKDIISKCEAEGIFDLKNHMSVVKLGLAESIREWFSTQPDITSVEQADPVDLAKVTKPPSRRRRRRADAQAGVEELASAPEQTGVALAPEAEAESPEEAAPAVETAPGESGAGEETARELAEEAATMPAVTAERSEPSVPAGTEAAPMRVSEAALPESTVRIETPEAAPPVPAVPATLAAQAPAPIEPPPPAVPAGPKLIPRPAELKGPRVIRVEAPEPTRTPAPRSRFAPPPPPAHTASTSPRRGVAKRRGGPSEEEAGRAAARRRGESEALVNERIHEWRDQDMLERRERLAGVTGHGLRDRRAAERRREASRVPPPGAAPSRRAAIEITVPISIREFCAAIQVPYAKLLPKLMETTGSMPNINQMLGAEVAELLAMEVGVPLQLARAKSALEKLEEKFSQLERRNVSKRPPVVTMLGHVDHGKTSLLDAIRKTNVAGGEAGGITQHIGAYRLDRGDWHVTFLDTPGHQAFTEMRARGAQLTDVVVLVVAADDGVMPQTVEAINHARAANVPIVVALNKIDLPNADPNRVFGQLAEHGILVTEWGGDVDVIRTAATSGVGIDALVAHLSTLSDLLDLQADPTIAVRGTVIEAQLREGKGVVATVLVREGTLCPGQAVVCGPAAGRVRSLVDSYGRRLTEAGPGTPVEVSGLDGLPATGDQLYQVESVTVAKEIAAEVASDRREKSLVSLKRARSLDEMMRQRSATEASELSIILKADVQGSLDALRAPLTEVKSAEVSVRILHSGVGAVTEADVRLAEASDAIIIGFHVVAEDRAARLAEDVGVEIRTYRIIYEVLDDIKRALEGMLSPETQVKVSGKAEVRQIFNLTKVGVVAGCMVMDGTVQRSNRVRVIRDGRIVRENAEMESLKRFKNDAREVAAGLECGIKLRGFDDLKPGDVLEGYEVTEVARTL